MSNNCINCAKLRKEIAELQKALEDIIDRYDSALCMVCVENDELAYRRERRDRWKNRTPVGPPSSPSPKKKDDAA